MLPSPILAPLDLAAPACRLAGCASVPSDVVSLQTVKPSMESLDQAPAHGSGLASPRRVNADGGICAFGGGWHMDTLRRHGRVRSSPRACELVSNH